MGAQPRAGRSHQAGTGEAYAPDRSLGRIRGWLSVCLSSVGLSLSFSCLSLSLMRLHLPPGSHRCPAAQAAHLWSERGSRRPCGQGRMQSPQHSRGGDERCWCQTACLLCPCVWAVGSASSICQRGRLGQAQRSVGRPGSSFPCRCLVHPLVCVPSAETQGQTLCSEAVGLCLQEREQTAGGQSGQLRRERQWQGGCLSVWLS